MLARVAPHLYLPASQGREDTAPSHSHPNRPKRHAHALVDDLICVPCLVLCNTPASSTTFLRHQSRHHSNKVRQGLTPLSASTPRVAAMAELTSESLLSQASATTTSSTAFNASRALQLFSCGHLYHLVRLLWGGDSPGPLPPPPRAACGWATTDERVTARHIP